MMIAHCTLLSNLQSERLRYYRDTASKLVREGAAYRCYCSKERLHSLHSQGMSYDGLCRKLSKREAEERARVEKAYVVRLKVRTGCQQNVFVRT